jgi:hypothetical protein
MQPIAIAWPNELGWWVHHNDQRYEVVFGNPYAKIDGINNTPKTPKFWAVRSMKSLSTKWTEINTDISTPGEAVLEFLKSRENPPSTGQKG